MNDDDIRRLLRQGARAPRRGVDLAMVRRRSVRRRAAVIGSGTLVVVLALGAVAGIPLTGPDEVVVFSPPDTTPQLVPMAPATTEAEPSTPEPEPTTPPPDPDPEPETEPAPESTEPPVVAGEPTEDTPAAQPTPAGTDHGAALWGRTFVIVAAAENGQPKALLADPRGRGWRTSFHNTPDPPWRGLGWRWGCNRKSSKAEVTADRLLLGSVASTTMGCEEGYGEQDDWSFKFFKSNPYWRLEGERLWLWTDDSLVELREDHEDEGW